MNTRTEARTKRVYEVANQRQPNITVVLENIMDPHNIMACLRTCDAIGMQSAHVIETIKPVFTTVIGKRSSTSAKKWVPVTIHSSVEDCYKVLREEKKQIFTTHLSEDSKELYEMDFTPDMALVFGNEQNGVSEKAVEMADGNFTIPMFGMIRSLNISVACAVTLYEALRQRKAAGLYDSRQLSDTDFNQLVEKWMGI